MATYMDAVNGKHTDGHEQGVNYPKVRYVHIVQVHPIELGEHNLHKVKMEREFETKAGADAWIKIFNDEEEKYGPKLQVKAVYMGRVNHETGELE